MQTIYDFIPHKEALFDTLIIDCSVIHQMAISVVAGDDYADLQKADGREPDEDAMLEVYYQIARRISMVAGAVQAPEVILALDTKPYWRTEFYNSYYEKAITYLYDPNGNGDVIVMWDGYADVATYNDAIQKWQRKTLTIAMQKEMGFDLKKDFIPENFFQFPGGVLSESEVERVKAIYGMESVNPNFDAWVVKEGANNTILDACVGKYKGKRKWKYGSIIEKPEFDSQTANFEYILAPLIKASEPIRIEKAEADDIIHSAVKIRTAAGKKVAVVSVDSDLHQLLVHYDNVFFIKPNQGFYLYETNRLALEYDYQAKIVGGDSSDNIKGVRKAKKKQKEEVWTGHTRPLGETKADQWMSQYRHNWEENKVLHLDPVTLARNETLIDLRNAPEEIQSQAEEKLGDFPRKTCRAIPVDTEDGGERELSLSDVYLGDKEILSLIEETNMVRTAISGTLYEYYGVGEAPAGSTTTEIPSTEDTVPTEAPVVEAPILDESQAVFEYTVVVEAHPTNPQFGQWNAGTVTATSHTEAINKLYAENPQFAQYLWFHQDSGLYYWWECAVTVHVGA